MAENKKSFLLYADLIHTIEKLPDVDAGELFKHILRYVNDQDPETDNLIVEIAFEPIKQALKRDLKNWESKQKQRSEAGKKSAEARKRKSNENQRPLKSVEQTSTNSTVNVNVNDNVNDINISKDITPTADFFIDKDLNQAFLEWIDYRKEIRKTLKPSTAQKQVKFLQRFDSKDAILIIEQSIQNGWTGLFEIKNKQNGTKETRDQKYQQEFNKIINKDQRKSASDYRNE